ncbi:efflux RND transporter periplasmic adaptor subunit [Sphingomonas sp. So64.6b]|uniref:efflux RND transporter periplasmic adaptor subunit n=1 Tax=Sphingomonas sp. So64.6b TaxID=2997354 RepID=UPI001602213D|nr:efflux RND transporter periplasmic adaptor subunit [Sphingomonas sp. So64.6b]QNA85242.1 efflux RND transporter periplasmic adaptor subunit [Sphingomonas sp. So64.6b]
MITQDKRLAGGVAAALLVAAAGGFGVARCTAPVGAPAIDKAVEAAPADSVAMTAAAMTEAGIVTEKLAGGGLGAEIVAQAMVTAAPNGEALVTARASGAVTRLFKRLGDPVRAGEALAIVESREAAQIAADRSTAAARATLAERNLARERYLHDQKVSARVDLERAEADAAAARAEARRAFVSGRAANVTRDGRGVIVTSPIAGRVTATGISLGAFVQAETELFRVADPRLIQVEAALGAADAPRVAAGDAVVIELPGGRTIAAQVRAVTPTLNGETRAATAVIDVVGSALQPGQSVRVRLKPARGATSTRIVVAEEAVQSLGGRDMVFVRTGSGFRARPVTIGQRSAGRIEIATGLRPGEVIATGNAFLLKAELAKGAGEEE